MRDRLPLRTQSDWANRSTSIRLDPRQRDGSEGLDLHKVRPSKAHAWCRIGSDSGSSCSAKAFPPFQFQDVSGRPLIRADLSRCSESARVVACHVLTCRDINRRGSVSRDTL